MSWFLLATISIGFFSAMNLLQRKIAVDSKYPRAMAVVFNVWGAIFGTLLFLFTEGVKNFVWPQGSSPWIFLALAALFYGLYEKGRFVSSKLVDASTLSVISNVSLPISFIGSLYLYSESLTTGKIIGFALVAISLLVVSIQNDSHKKLSLKGILIAVMVFIFLGLAITLDKKGSLLFNPSTYNILVWVVPLPLIYLPYVKTKEILHEMRTSSWRVILLAGLNVVGYYLYLKALAIGDATRILPYVQVTSLITVLLGIFLLGERDHIWRKIIAGIIGFAGALLLVAG